MVKFSCHQKVIYPGHGVAIIDRIVEKSIAGKMLQFFELRFLNKDMTILVPTDNASDVGIRPLSSIDDINNILQKLARPAIVKSNDAAASNWNKRNKEYQNKLRSGDLSLIGSIYRDLRHIEYHKELSFGEKSLLEKTESLLIEEITIVNNMEADSATECIRNLVGYKMKQKKIGLKIKIKKFETKEL